MTLAIGARFFESFRTGLRPICNAGQTVRTNPQELVQSMLQQLVDHCAGTKFRAGHRLFDPKFYRPS
jgi:hypothetical protein